LPRTAAGAACVQRLPDLLLEARQFRKVIACGRNEGVTRLPDRQFQITQIGANQSFEGSWEIPSQNRWRALQNDAWAFSPKYALTRICAVEYIKTMESVFEIIAEPNRRAILSLLVSSQQSVGEIERQLRMSQPTVSKHLRVLREAGFVESMVDRQRRLYRLKPRPFQEVDAWLEQFRRFWSDHVDALERHLDRMEQLTPAKGKTRRRRRGRNRQRDQGGAK